MHIKLRPQLPRGFCILRTITLAIVATVLFLFFAVSPRADEVPPTIPSNVSPKLRELMERSLSADAGERKAAARNLGDMRKDAIPAIPFMIRLLDDEVDSMGSAFRALKNLGEPAVQPLIDHLSHCTSARRRQTIALLLSYLEDRRAVEPLIRLLDDNDAEVRHAAACALGSFRDSKAFSPLLARLRDSNAKVRSNAAWALGKIGDGNAVEPLIEAIKDKESRVRSSAAYALSSIPDSRSLQPLLACLQDADQNVRRNVILALGKLKDARAVEPLISIFQCDSDKQVRDGAAFALGEIGDTRAVEPFIAAIKSGTNQGAAAWALGDLHDSRALDVLTEMFFKQKRAQIDRVRACVALGKLSDGRAAEPLVTVWKNETEILEIRLVAATSLGRTRDHRAIDALAFVLEKGYRPWTHMAVELLGERKDPRAKKLLYEALNNYDDAVRMAATIAIKKQELDEKLEKEEEE